MIEECTLPGEFPSVTPATENLAGLQTLPGLVHLPLYRLAFRATASTRERGLLEVTVTDSPDPSPSSQANPKHPKEGRNVWIVTVYSIAGLALLGVLGYYISNYFAK